MDATECNGRWRIAGSGQVRLADTRQAGGGGRYGPSSPCSRVVLAKAWRRDSIDLRASWLEQARAIWRLTHSFSREDQARTATPKRSFRHSAGGEQLAFSGSWEEIIGSSDHLASRRVGNSELRLSRLRIPFGPQLRIGDAIRLQHSQRLCTSG